MTRLTPPARWALWLPLALFAASWLLVLIGLLRPGRPHEVDERDDRQAAARIRPAPRRARPAGPGHAPIWPTASRGCSTSSPAGACPARPRRRSWRSSARRGGDRRRRDPRPAGGRRRRSSPATAIRSPDRRGRCQRGADRARFVGRAGNLRDRWQGRDPLPAHRRDPRRAGAADPRRSCRRRGNEALAVASCCCVAARRAAGRSRMRCRPRPMPIASWTIPRRRPRPGR